MHAERTQGVFIRTIADFCAGYAVRQFCNERIAAVGDHHLAAEAGKRAAQVAPKAPKADNKNRFHWVTSLADEDAVLRTAKGRQGWAAHNQQRKRQASEASGIHQQNQHCA